MGNTWGWASGGGGGGRIKVFTTTNEFMGAVQAGGGAGGASPPDANSSPGLAGQAGTTAMLGAIPPALDNVSCG